MPIYEYECQDCQNVLEVIQRISEEPLSHCPDCSGTLKKMVSMSAFHLKGGGWYADGYNSASAGAGKTSCSVKPDATEKVGGTPSCPKGQNSTACSGCNTSS